MPRSGPSVSSSDSDTTSGSIGVVVKNTFIEMLEDDSQHPMPRRRALSEGRLSTHSGTSGSRGQELPRYFPVSLSTPSSSASRSHQEALPAPLPLGGSSALPSCAHSASDWPPQSASVADSPPGSGRRSDLAMSAPSELVLRVHAETGVDIAILDVLDRTGRLGQVPRDEQGQLSSVGSLQHGQEQCTPCLFWYRRACSKGVACEYCHFRHRGQRAKRIRPSKKTRQQMKADAHDRSGGTPDPEAGPFGLDHPGPAAGAPALTHWALEQQAMQFQ